MNVFNEGIETQQLYEFLRHKQATDTQLIALAQLAQRLVLEYVPNAKLLYTCNKQGQVIAAGVYDAPLCLNERGQFRPIQQYAPQLLSKKVECKATHHATLRLKIECDVWLDAVLHVARKTPALANTLTLAIHGDDYLSPVN